MRNDPELIALLLEAHDIETTHLPELLVSMRTGGKSNGSWSEHLLDDHEVLRALRTHRLQPDPPIPAATHINLCRRMLVTGASGFVGRSVVRSAAEKGLEVRAATRRAISDRPDGVDAVGGLELEPDTNWAAALKGISDVVHCAARVHVMRDLAANPLAEFRRVNTAACLELASQAAAAGVQRFVFISTIFVNGIETHGIAFRADDRVAPSSPYAVSKHEAEEGLRQIAASTGMEVVIVRPPLVYGPGVKGNFERLMQAVHRGIPLPLGAVTNQRSLVALDNLVNLILTCVYHPAAANQTFLVSDGEDLSTSELLRRTAQALGRTIRLLPLPTGAMRAVAKALGRGDLAQRLLGSQQVDISKTRSLLGWNPVVSVEEGLRPTAAHFLSDSKKTRS